MSHDGAVRVLYFAWLREHIGHGEETVRLADGVRDVAGLMASLRARGPGYAKAFEHEKLVRCAINQTVARPDAAIAAGDEVAFFPPVTGG